MLADLALVGFGNVGRRFVRLLDERRHRLQQDCDLTCRVIGIATKRHGAICGLQGIDAVSAAGIVEGGRPLTDVRGADTSSDVKDSADMISRLGESAAPLRVLVETTTLDITEGQPAISHVKLALEAGCDVVTANKGPAAFAYDELSSLASAKGRSFLFEGAVMDGVPIFNLVRHAMPGMQIRGFRGVVNSTTNHILTAIEDGEEFAPALARMQADGIAEADPSLDVDGWDAAAKAAALANVFLGARVTPHDVERTGLGPDIASQARAAKAKGRRLRLLAYGARGVRPAVRLVELPASDLLAGLRGTSNALILDTDTLGEIAICQLDGGLTHTAYALMSDLIAIRRRCSP
jgi:homoserine dehydrogenase